MLADIVERLSNWKHASFRRDGSTLETMMEAADEITSLREQLEKAKKDGERYRWLRHGDNDALVIQHGPVAPDYHWLPRNERLDEMIDNAMKAK